MTHEEILTTLGNYVDYLIAGSSAEAPLWNIEKVRSGKPNKWNYVDGCMITACLSLYKTTGDEKFLKFSRDFVDYFVKDGGEIYTFDANEHNLDNINQGKNLFSLYDLTGEQRYRDAINTIRAQLDTQPRTKSSIPHRIFPQYALVDGKYLASAPKRILVNTSVDSLGHLIESYINLGASPFSRMISEYGMALWKDVKPALLSDHVTDEDRDRMMLTSTLAGMAITHAGTTLPHGLSYFLTYEMHIPHGQAVGYFQPGYVAAAAPETQAKVLELIGCKDIAEFTNLIHTLLGPLEIAPNMVDTAIKGIMANERKLKPVPYEVTEETLRKFFEMAM